MEEPTATAQDAYRLMLRAYIAPALRELGFRRGPSPGAFRYETATHAAEVRFRKSRGSTRQEVNFWTDMHTSDITTEWVYWERNLHSLANSLGELAWPWEVSSGGPVEPVAGEVLRVSRDPGRAGQPRLPERPHGPVATDVSEDSPGAAVRRRDRSGTAVKSGAGGDYETGGPRSSRLPGSAHPP